MNKWKKIIIGVLIAVISVFVLLGYDQARLALVFYNKVVNNKMDSSIDIAQDPEVMDLELAETTYQLIEGWNLVAFPVKPIEFDTAAGLMADILNKGGYVTTVSVWDGDNWQEFAQRGKSKFGFDFEIEAGKSYFLKSEQQFAWRVAGDKVEEAQAYKLEPGWNTIGFVKEGMDAREVIDEINQGQEKATVLDWWTPGSQWELFIKRFLSEGDVREYGENFSIEPQKGYMIFVNEALDWRLE
jgi:hypothetical protein